MTEPVPHPRRPGEARTAASRRERRASPRAWVGYLRCGLPAPAVILDVSREGLRIESFRPYRLGDRVLMNTVLTGRPERIAGEVRWCRRIATAGKGQSNVYQVGIALQASLEERWLAALVESRPPRSAQRAKPAVSSGTESRRR